MDRQTKVTLEQEFDIRKFGLLVQQMNREQAQDCLVDLYEQMLVKDNLYKSLLKYAWGIEPLLSYPNDCTSMQS
jgi:hypothetical protein